jgi:hypothetical protein
MPSSLSRLHKVCSRSHDAVIRVYDEAGNVIEKHDHTGEFKDREVFTRITSPFQLINPHDSAIVE